MALRQRRAHHQLDLVEQHHRQATRPTWPANNTLAIGRPLAMLFVKLGRCDSRNPPLPDCASLDPGYALHGMWL
jgi:hypothetical protein